MKRLGLIAVSTGFLASLSLGQNVTISAKAEPLSDVLTELSRQSGKSLQWAGYLQDEPIVLSFRDQPIEEVMKRIASVTGCKWTESGSGMMLERDRDAEKQDRDRQAAAKTAQAKTAISEWLKSNPPKEWSADVAKKEVQADVDQMNQILEQVKQNNPNFGGAGSNLFIQVSGGTNSTPTAMALRSLIENFPAEALANLSPMERVVYSTGRTQRQLAMPASTQSQQVLRKFITDYNMLVSARTNAIQPGPGIQYLSELTQATTPISWPVKALLVLNRPAGARSQTVLAELKIADSTGRIVGTANASFNLAPKAAEEGEISDAGTVIQLSDMSEQLVRTLAQYKVLEPSNSTIQMSGGGSFRVSLSRPGEGNPPPLSQEMLRLITQPGSLEPLSFHVAECLMQLAADKNVSLAALPNDEIFIPLAKLLSTGTVSTERLRLELIKAGLEVSIEDGWMEVKTPVRADAYNTRVSRDDLGALQSTILRNGYASLREVGKYALNMESPSLDQAYITILNKPAADILFGSDQERLFLQLIGAIQFADPQRVTAGEVPVSGLTPQQRRIVEQIYYGPFGGGSLGGGRSVMIGMSSGDDGPPEQKVPSLRDEPTEAYPQGLPNNAMLKISLEEIEDAVLARSPNSHRAMFFTAQSMGMTQNFLERGQSFGMDTLNPSTPGITFQPGQATGVSIGLTIGEDGAASTHFQEAWVLTGSQAVPMAQLPASFLDAVKQAKEQSNGMNFNFGDGNRRQPPPR